MSTIYTFNAVAPDIKAEWLNFAKMGEFTVSKYKSGDEAAIIELYQKSFHRSLDYKVWKWRYCDNPFGAEMIRLMWDEDKLIGHYAVCPVELKIENQILKTALSLTTMTHPDYTGRGIFSKLASILYEELHSESGISFYWGFPNNQSHYGFIKNLKWKDIYEIPNFRLEDFRRISAYSECRKVDKFSSKHISAIAEYDSNPELIEVNRTVDYLNWRYDINSGNQYQIYEIVTGHKSNPFVVVKEYGSDGGTEIDLMEIVCPDDERIISSLLHAALNGSDKSINAINLWMSPENPKHLILEKFGFMNKGGVTYLSGLPVGNIAKEILLDKKYWNYNFSYSDVY